MMTNGNMIYGREIMLISPPNSRPKVALFDFDGTVSLIRAGWQDVMIPYFTDVLMSAPEAESRDKAEVVVHDFVETLTGKQTIFQCEQLDREVVARGGAAVDPYEYKKEYLSRLMEKINYRHRGLENGSIKREELLVPGIGRLIDRLHAEGIRCYLASGTDEEDVIREAKLLGIDKMFDGGIYGARDEIKDCSKELVIRKIISENGISGADILSFGDGYVEIELIAKMGGYAVGAATLEKVCVPGEYREANSWKVDRLTAAGASMIIPDFEDYDRVLDIILHR